MKIFGIINLIISAILYVVVFVNAIKAWFRRDRNDFTVSLTSALLYALWAATAICLIVVS